MNIFILTKVKIQSINDFVIPDRQSNKLRSDAIRLDTFYVCDFTNNEVQEDIFPRK